MAEDLVLDTAIRDWVLIPLSVVMVLIGVLRYFVSNLMRTFQNPDGKIVKEGQWIIRARNLRSSADFIPPKSFRARRTYYSNELPSLAFGGESPNNSSEATPKGVLQIMNVQGISIYHVKSHLQDDDVRARTNFLSALIHSHQITLRTTYIKLQK